MKSQQPAGSAHTVQSGFAPIATKPYRRMPDIVRGAIFCLSPVAHRRIWKWLSRHQHLHHHHLHQDGDKLPHPKCHLNNHRLQIITAHSIVHPEALLLGANPYHPVKALLLNHPAIPTRDHTHKRQVSLPHRYLDIPSHLDLNRLMPHHLGLPLA